MAAEPWSAGSASKTLSVRVRTRVQTPSVHIKLGMEVHTYNLSSPMARQEVESGGLTKLVGQRPWCIEQRTITERDPVSNKGRDKD